MAKTYQINLLPLLQEQVAFYQAQHGDLTKHIEKLYGDFLKYVDGKSEKMDGAELDALQMVYHLAATRLEMLQSMLGEEAEITEFWGKKLSDVDASRDDAAWQEVATAMFEDGDYRLEVNDFKTMIIEDVTEMKEGLGDLLEDWQEAIEEGEVLQVAALLESLVDMEDDENEPEDDDACDTKEGGACCDNAEEGEEGGECCGQQTPCCRSGQDDE